MLFEELDLLLVEFPKEISLIIFEYYDICCKFCQSDVIECEECCYLFHIYHICYQHHSIFCTICDLASCPFIKLRGDCVCEFNKKCRNCFVFVENVEEFVVQLDEVLDELLVDFLQTFD